MSGDEYINGQLSIFDLAPDLEPKPQTFAEYVGQCKYCMWYGYGLYDYHGNRRKDAGPYACQWERPDKVNAFQCKNRGRWKPNTRSIPKLCGNCIHANCFHYQTKPEYKDKESIKAFEDPLEEPNIYCTAPDGSVNRQYPYKAFYEEHFGACLWDRQHEWDSCDAWQRDGSILKEDKA